MGCSISQSPVLSQYSTMELKTPDIRGRWWVLFLFHRSRVDHLVLFSQEDSIVKVNHENDLFRLIISGGVISMCWLSGRWSGRGSCPGGTLSGGRPLWTRSYGLAGWGSHRPWSHLERKRGEGSVSEWEGALSRIKHTHTHTQITLIS